MPPTDLPTSTPPAPAAGRAPDPPEAAVTDPEATEPDEGAATEPPTTSTSGPPPGPGGWPRLAVVLVAVLAASTLAATALWRSAAADPTTDIRDAAVTFTTRLTTWDASEGLDGTTEALRAMGTGDFLEEVDDVLGGGIQETAEAVGARSAGEVVEVFANGDGVAIVIVRQALTVGGVTDVQEQIARLELVEVDGEWKIARVELLNAPVLLEEGGS